MMHGAIARAREIVRATPGAYLPNQFSQPRESRSALRDDRPRDRRAARRPHRRVGRRRRNDGHVHRRRALPLGAPSRDPARRGRAAGLDPRRRRGRPARRRGYRPLQLSADPRPQRDRRGHDDRGRRRLRRPSPPALAKRGPPRRRLLGRRRRGRAARRAAARARQDRRHALPRRRRAVSGQGIFEKVSQSWQSGHDRDLPSSKLAIPRQKETHGLFAPTAFTPATRPTPRPAPSPCPIYQTSTYVQEGLGKNKGYEYGAHPEPDAHGARGEPGGPRGRRRRARVRLRHGRDHRDLHLREDRATTSSAPT